MALPLRFINGLRRGVLSALLVLDRPLLLGVSLRWLVGIGVVPPLLGLLAEQVSSRIVSGLQECLNASCWGVPDSGLEAPLDGDRFIRPEALPLYTSGRWLLDRQGRRVQLRCVNWYGAHLKTYVVGGLDRQPLSRIAFSIRALGFNCVRLPYSLELQLSPSAKPADGALRANPSLLNKTGFEVFDATVSALTAAQLLVILNNHQGRAMWCCDENDGEGLWYSEGYPEEAWLSSLHALAQRYREDPYVVGYDLRNEPRGVPYGTGTTGLRGSLAFKKRPTWAAGPADTDWAAAALKGALEVTHGDPHALVVVEGLDFATDLRGLHRGGKLHQHADLRGRVVYEVHDYTWYHTEFLQAWYLHWACLGWTMLFLWETWHAWRLQGSPGLNKDRANLGAFQGKLRFTRSEAKRRSPLIVVIALLWCLSCYYASYGYYASVISDKWGFLLENNEAPVWLGEFGTNGIWVTADWWMEVGEVTWWQHVLRYIRENEVGYAYWALNGDKAGEDETFGILDRDYRTLRHPLLSGALP